MPAPEQRLPWRTDWSVLTPLDLGRDLFPFAALRQARQCRLYDSDGLFLAYRVVDAKVPANVKTQVYAYVYTSGTDLDGHYARTQVGKEEICLYFLQAGGGLSLRLKLHPEQESKLRLRKGKRISDLRISVTAAKLQRLKRQGISVATLLGLVAREDLPLVTEDTMTAIPERAPFNAGWAKGAGYAHGNIEYEALKDIFKIHEIVKIYYGNWLRDYSQIAVPMIIRPPEDQRKKVEILARYFPRIQKMLDFAQNQMSHDGIVKLLEIVAVAEFVAGSRDMQEMAWLGHDRESHNFIVLLKVFRDHFGPLTKDILGIYRPEEHLDNTFGLPDESMLDYVQYRYEHAVGQHITVFPYAGEKKPSLYNDCGAHSLVPAAPRGLKHYLFHDIYPNPTAPTTTPATYYPAGRTYIMQQLKLAAYYGRTQKGYRHLGAALHVLEDYFAHTNFCEISLIKIGFDSQADPRLRVYPFIQKVEETGYVWKDDARGDQYRVVLPPYKIDKGEVSPVATYLPVVTGRFLLDDTLASLLPKVGDAVFNTDYQPYYQLKAGERTMADMMILTILEEYTASQAHLPEAERKRFSGLTAGEWLQKYNYLLSIVDGYRKWRDNSGWIGEVMVDMERILHDAMQEIIYYPKLILQTLLGYADDLVKIEQDILKSEFGTNPSHTQLAKDDLEGALNFLAGRLAVHAVRDVGARMAACWDKKHGGIALAHYVVDTYFVHPCKTKWMDGLVRTFAEEWPGKVYQATFESPLDGLEAYNELAQEELERLKVEALKVLNKL